MALRKAGLFFAVFLVPLTACTPTVPLSEASALPPLPPQYTLGAGDVLHVQVYGEDQLTGDYRVMDNGQVSFPLIGEIKADGLTLDGFRDGLTNKLNQGYLNNSRVNVQVSQARPFYIKGEVKSPSALPTTPGLTVEAAIAQAGGYTYRADRKSVIIRRNGGPEIRVPISSNPRIGPGDIITVPETSL